MMQLEGKKDDGFSISTLLLLIGITAIGFNLYDKHDRFYMGDPLISRQIILAETPEPYSGSKGIDHYFVPARGYKGNFWISENACTILRSHAEQLRQLEHLIAGDTAVIKFRPADTPLLQEASDHIRIMELIAGNKVIVSAKTVAKEESRSAVMIFTLGIIALVAGLITKAMAWRQKRLSEAAGE